MKFVLLDLVLEEAPEFGTLSILDASLFERYSVNVKHAYRHASNRRDTCMNETVRVEGCRMD